MIPDKFRITIENFPSCDTYEFNFNGDELVYRYSTRGDETKAEARVRPNSEQWQSFRNELDEIRIWDWNSKYFCPTVDGQEWSIDIRYLDRKIFSIGLNCYPGNQTGSTSKFPSKHFLKFMKSIGDLMSDVRFWDQWELIEESEDDD